MTSTSQFSIGALGGTFDHFHKGHEHFLKFASEQAEQLLIGVTNQSLIREKELSSIIEPYEVRTAAIRSFCEREHINYEIVELTDPYGPTLGQRPVDCLIVTELTTQGGEELNKKRTENQLPSLPVFVSTMLRDESGKILNSTRIRKGLVNREGSVYEKLFEKDLKINEKQRAFLQVPLGDVVTERSISANPRTGIVAVVGDISLASFLKNHLRYDLGVFDHRSRRTDVVQPELQSIIPDERVENKAGYIQTHAVQKILLALSSLSKIGGVRHVQIDGEEDLMAVALILLLPLESVLYYGQPNAGLIEVPVNESLKQTVYNQLL